MLTTYMTALMVGLIVSMALCLTGSADAEVLDNPAFLVALIVGVGTVMGLMALVAVYAGLIVTCQG